MCMESSRRDRNLLDMFFYAMVVLCLGLIVGHASAAEVKPISATDNGHELDRVAANLLDRDTATFWDSYPFVDGDYAQFDFGLGNASAFDAYRYESYNGGNYYTAWTLYASNDTSHWDTLNVQTGQALSGGASKMYNFTNAVKYRYLRFTGNSASANEPCVAEMYFHATPPVSSLQSGCYTIMTFSKGTSTWVAPPGVSSVEYLVVGGGGSGGGFAGGGGGAGALETSTLAVTPGTSYTAVVGAGGAAVSTNAIGNAGGDSSFSTVTAVGGGAGGGGGLDGGNGGSGGGGAASMVSPYNPTSGGSATDGGNAGGDGVIGADAGGGGGGEGAAGSDGVSQTGGAGGAGTASSITGTSVTYAAGGGGSGYATGGAGGSGGGGLGGTQTDSGVDAFTNTGSGGGGLYVSGSGRVSGAGAAGIVVLKYLSYAQDTTTIAGYTIITLQSGTHGTDLVTNWTAPANVTSIEYLLVAGGGGGGGSFFGSSGSGGGGAGGYLNGTALAVTPGTDYAITVGKGGPGGMHSDEGAYADGLVGTNTTAFGLTAIYGGGGAGLTNRNGISGASGGGGSNGGTGAAAFAGGQGNNGGNGATATRYPGGGGGGAGAVGANAVGNTGGGAGGAGLSTSISGANAWYAGGGAGASDAGTAALGGSGVGGNGAIANTVAATAGTDGRGGGGGGTDSIGETAGKDGGNGVVIIKYLSNNLRVTNETVGAYTVLTFDTDTETIPGQMNWTIPDGVTDIDYLVVGGGAGGAGDVNTGIGGGGGGAGGLIHNETVNLSSLTGGGNSIFIRVGQGGTGGTGRPSTGQTAGGYTVLGKMNVTGGSPGVGYGLTGTQGGSGGGGSGLTASHGTGIAGQGYDGGEASLATGGSGGGGAGAVGANAATGNGGAGGAGYQSSINGTAQYYAGGGGGSKEPTGSTSGSGGSGVGGNGGLAATAGTAHTGSGGGGTYNTGTTGGAGASGRVIIKYSVDVPEVPLPVPSFTSNVTIGLQNLAVAFTDTSDCLDPTGYNWSFGNGNYSALQSPTYTYYTLGNHTVTFTVTNASGFDFATGYVEVLQRYAPIVNFTTNVSSGYAPLDVGFTDISFTDILTWNWTFGTPAGNYSELQNPSFSFTEVGTVPITLTVTNASSTNTTTLYITTTTPPEAPLCMYTPATNRSVLWPAGIKLTSTSTNSPTNMSWNWGDGVTTYGNVSSKHIYAFPGKYHINVSATNVGGTTYNNSYVQVVP